MQHAGTGFRPGPSILVVVFVALVVALVPAETARAKICWFYSGVTPSMPGHPATNPQPWNNSCGDGGDTLFPPGSTSGQLIGHEHRNWHCTNPVEDTEAYGQAFLAFHRQFILDFDNWRLANTTSGRIEVWDPKQNAPVPGDDETTNTAFTHCSDANGPNPGVRPAGALCAGCETLPAEFTMNLADFSSLGHVGRRLEISSWHGSFHNGVGFLGCRDIWGFLHTPRDPAFWMAHKKLDEVARDWQSLQATDVVIVLDRSGSMADNCPGGQADPGETPCKLNDAKMAAKEFANIVLDQRLEGGAPAGRQHRIALVSFSTTAMTELALTPAQGIVTNNRIDDTPFETALAGITASGTTSIAAGIRQAIAILKGVPDPNPHQAILVLTDGMENTSPCLGGHSPSSCVPVGDGTLTAAELGDIQVVAVGFGEGAEEANLRDVAERHAGIFVAQADPNDVLRLRKFFVTAFGRIFDAGVAADPRGTLEGGRLASDPINIEICGDDRLSVVLGWEPTRTGVIDGPSSCDLEIELRTPSGNLVLRSAPGVEAGHGEGHDFLHVNLPHLGESTGTWTARVVRAAESCLQQPIDYFDSVLVKGLGRIEPFVARPDVVVGRPILATFRITESNRPIGDFASVSADVTLTRPDGTAETRPLFDDATHGDTLADNNVWSLEFPAPAMQPGPHHLHAHFVLTEDSCQRVREAEYTIPVQREPEQCTRVVAGGPVGGYERFPVRPGQVRQLDELACVWNACATPDQYEVQISDSRGWLRTLDHKPGALSALPRSFRSGTIPAFGEVCFGRGPQQDNPAGGIPLLADIPRDAQPGDTSEVAVRVMSRTHTDQAPVDVATTIPVMPPPDCNNNGIDDAIDIAHGFSRDADRNGVPDECEEPMFGVHHDRNHRRP